MNLKLLFQSLTKFERILWFFGVSVITLSFLLSGAADFLTVIASLIGITSLIFIARGYVIGQVLTIVFAVLYGVISFRYRYYGEMLTYLCMTAPAAAATAVVWFKNPFEKTREVKVNSLTKRKTFLIAVAAAGVTTGFYFILLELGNANIVFSTISVATSFVASALTFFRSPAYAVAYAANDVVLIVLWVLATIENIAYLPMIICFFMFFINDLYGFYSWRKMRARQLAVQGEKE